MKRAFCLLPAAVSLFAAMPRPAWAKAKRPNIVYILADDLGYGDIQAFNPQSNIPTPRLDQLAAQGIRLTDAHSADSVCTPSRYGVLTGQYCWRSPLHHGVIGSYGRTFLSPGQETVAKLLKAHGYATGVVGKWHLGLDWTVKGNLAADLKHPGSVVNQDGVVVRMSPDDIDFSGPVTGGPETYGFDYSYVLPASLDIPPYCFVENGRLVKPPTATTPGHDLDTGFSYAFWRPGRMAPGFDFSNVLPTVAAKGIAFMEREVHRGVPFFLYLPLTAPHTPWVPTAEFRHTSGAGPYGDFVHMTDAYVGKVLDAIHALGIEDNTLVIFTSDNGPYWRPAMIARYHHRAAYIFRGMKADIWEGGHRIPYIARWPGKIRAGSVSPALTSLTHLIATVADVLGLPDPHQYGEDSYSILPVLLGKTNQVPGQPGIMMHSSKAHFAWREGDWKFIEQRGSGGFTSPVVFPVTIGEAPDQLYNLREDPSETHNLYFWDPARVAALRRDLNRARGTP